MIPKDKTPKEISLEEKSDWNERYSKWAFDNQIVVKAKKTERLVINYIFKQIPISPNAEVLDLGCGMGYKSHLIYEMGYNVTGVDISDVGIIRAKQLWDKRIEFRVCDILENPLDTKFDVIFASSFSLFKYDFRNGDNYYGKTVFSYLKSGGYLIFDWASNSKWKEKHADWAYISFQNAEKYFSQFGKIIGIWASYRELFPILKSFSLSRPITYLVIFFSHFFSFGYRLYCIVRKI